MVFHSILYDKVPDYIKIRCAVMPHCFVDLNLIPVIDAITAGRQDYHLRPFFYSPLHDAGTVRFRQEICQDLENEALLEAVKTFTQHMALMRQYLDLSERLEFHYHKAGWFLEAVSVYCGAISGLTRQLSRVELGSRGFRELREYLNEYVKTPYFQILIAETGQRKAVLASIHYAILIKGSRVSVRRYRSEIDYSKEVEQTFEKFNQGAVKDYRSALGKPTGMSVVEGKILDCVVRLYPEAFADLDQYCKMHHDFWDEVLRNFDQEVQVYIAYLEWIQKFKRSGLKFCYPVVSAESKEVSVEDGFDIALAHKLVTEDAAVVCNDFSLKDPERIMVVSGPNQGGKTTFARMFGQIHYLASLGLPVPGRQARLFLFDRIFTHFEKEENIQNLRGKLQDDLTRIHAILERATPASIIIMNEIFTSTSLKDAVYLSKKVLERITGLDLLCVCVTFLDELASLNEKTISMVSSVVPENPALRTFKIARMPANGLAYALSIAEKYHLTRDQLKERIKK